MTCKNYQKDLEELVAEVCSEIAQKLFQTVVTAPLTEPRCAMSFRVDEDSKWRFLQATVPRGDHIHPWVGSAGVRYQVREAVGEIPGLVVEVEYGSFPHKEEEYTPMPFEGAVLYYFPMPDAVNWSIRSHETTLKKDLADFFNSGFPSARIQISTTQHKKDILP